MARPKEFDTTEAVDQALRVFWSQGFTATSLDDLIAAMEISLDSDDITKLESVFVPGVTAGTRYPAGQMKRIGI